MNKSTALQFDADGSVLLLTDQSASGFAATVQNALVNLLTEQESDALFPDRGTALLQRSLDGGYVDTRAAAHQANFAASDTLFFGRNHDTADAGDKLAEVRLEVHKLNLVTMELRASFTSVAGVTLSYQLNNPVA